MEEKKEEDIKIVTHRPDGQKREYSNYVEFSINPRDLTLKFCDLKPAASKEEFDAVQSKGKIDVLVNSEVVIPFDVAEEVVSKLQKHIDKIRKENEKEAN